MTYERPVRTTLSAKNLIYRGVPKHYIHANLDQYPISEDKKEMVSKYMKHLGVMLSDKIDLIMYGSNGSGKTYLSSLIVKECYRKRYSSYRVTLEEYLQMLFKSNDPMVAEKINKVETCEFLVIDEVGKETFSQTQFNIVKFEELLRKRDTLGVVTIICTNLPLEGNNGLYNIYGKSITSLINGNFLKIEFTEEDNRLGVTKEKQGIKLLFGEE